MLAFSAALASSGCMYIFSEKRTVYQYEPNYGVDSPEFRRSLDALGTEMVPGNRTALLEDAGGIFPRMLEAIGSAQTSINLELYIFRDDETGSRFARALVERARAGVEVRILVDGFGSSARRARRRSSRRRALGSASTSPSGSTPSTRSETARTAAS